MTGPLGFRVHGSAFRAVRFGFIFWTAVCCFLKEDVDAFRPCTSSESRSANPESGPSSIGLVVDFKHDVKAG